jgi:hypothetical protein
VHSASLQSPHTHQQLPLICSIFAQYPIDSIAPVGTPNQHPRVISLIHTLQSPRSHRRHCFPHSLRLPPSHFPHNRSTSQIWLLVPPLINLALSAHLPTRPLRGGRNGRPRRRPSAPLVRHHYPGTGTASTGDRRKDPCFCDKSREGTEGGYGWAYGTSAVVCAPF